MNITKALDLRHCFCIDVNALIYAELKLQICINFEEKKLNKKRYNYFYLGRFVTLAPDFTNIVMIKRWIQYSFEHLFICRFTLQISFLRVP